MGNANTSHRAAELPSDALGASSTSEVQFSKAGTTCTLYMKGSNIYKDRPFRISLWGRTTTGASTNVTIKLYQGTTAGTNLATSGAIALNTASGNWCMSVKVMLDAVSQKIQGVIETGWINATAIAAAIQTTAVTAIDPAVGTTFTASVTHSASNAGTSSVLLGFEMEAL